jgi:2-polyprenyl-3-methyl-5-hydroxy-6-metoxy-1,4-benzoquinol methylase
MIPPKHDVIGQAGIDFMLSGNNEKSIKVWSDVAEVDFLAVRYFFRDFNEMPLLEQKALMLSKGRILDVGAGMGSHALYLQNLKMDVTALELSPLACEVMKRRGVANVLNDDFFDLKSEVKYDTILMMMNGIGLVGKISQFPRFFKQAANLLAPGGQILIDSSDLRYLFLDDDGSLLVNLSGRYYGEVVYKMSYEECQGKRFPWLFIDDELLAYYAGLNGFKFEKLAEGPHYDFMGRLYLAT